MSTATMSPFGTKANNKEGGDFELTPAGLHSAVLIGVIDLGTHPFTYQGKTNTPRKIFLVWELTAEHTKEGETFVVGADYTWSLNKKATVRHMLEAWIGRAFAEDEEFDPLKLIGKPCVVNVSIGQSAKGQKFAEITNVASPMKGQQVPPATRESCIWHMSQLTCKKEPIIIPDWMPRIYGRLLSDDIKASDEWKALPETSAAYEIDNPSNGHAPVDANGKPAY